MAHAEFHEVSMELDEELGEELGRSVAASKKKDSGLSSFLSHNGTLVAWLVFLGFGGALLTFYHSQINYFPELEWDQSFAYLVALTILGGGAAASYGFSLFLPGFIWSEFLVFDTRLQKHFCYAEPRPIEPCFLSLWNDLALPFGAFMLVVHFPMQWPRNPYVFPATAIGLIGLFFLYRGKLRAAMGTPKRSPETDPRYFKYMASALIAAFVSSAALICLYFFAAPEGHSWRMLSICTILVVVSNVLVAVQFRNKPGRALLTGFIAGLMVLFFGEVLPDESRFSIQLLKQFGLGGSLDKSLVVTDEGRAILVSQDITTKKGEGKDSVLYPVRILSRLGTDYYIEACTDHQKLLRLTIPKKFVHSWATESLPSSKAQESCQPGSGVPQPAAPTGASR